MTALSGGLSPVVVVTGSYAEQVETEVKDLPVKIVRNNDWLEGQGSSICAGMDQLPADTGAVIFMLVDQPQVNPSPPALADRFAYEGFGTYHRSSGPGSARQPCTLRSKHLR